jgi:hypothetical protein
MSELCYVHGTLYWTRFLFKYERGHKDQSVSYCDGSYAHTRNLQSQLNSTDAYIKHTRYFRPTGRLYNKCYHKQIIYITCLVVGSINFPLTNFIYISQRRNILFVLSLVSQEVGCFLPYYWHTARVKHIPHLRPLQESIRTCTFVHIRFKHVLWNTCKCVKCFH